jgi:hypothetical protein
MQQDDCNQKPRAALLILATRSLPLHQMATSLQHLMETIHLSMARMHTMMLRQGRKTMQVRAFGTLQPNHIH